MNSNIFSVIIVCWYCNLQLVFLEVVFFIEVQSLEKQEAQSHCKITFCEKGVENEIKHITNDYQLASRCKNSGLIFPFDFSFVGLKRISETIELKNRRNSNNSHLFWPFQPTSNLMLIVERSKKFQMKTFLQVKSCPRIPEWKKWSRFSRRIENSKSNVRQHFYQVSVFLGRSNLRCKDQVSSFFFEWLFSEKGGASILFGRKHTRSLRRKRFWKPRCIYWQHFWRDLPVWKRN